MAPMRDLEKALSKLDTDKKTSSLSPNDIQVTVREIPEAHTPCTELDSAPLLPPLDGGAGAWIQVLNNVLVNILAWGYPSAFGVFQLYYSTEMLAHVSASQISWIGSLQTFLCFLTCAPAGRLADAGYARGATVAGACFLVLGTFLTSFCRGVYWQVLLAQGVCSGIGLGFVYMPAVVVMTAYFDKKQALAMGLGCSGKSSFLVSTNEEASKQKS